MVTKEELDKLCKAYSEGHPLIDDAEYDALVEEYVKQNGESARPFNRQKQSSAVNEIVGTLPKVYGVYTPMREGQKTYAEYVTKNIAKFKDCWVATQYKFDGCSIGFDYQTEKFYTRGDYDNGESVDVTDLFKDRIADMYTLNKFAGGDLKSAKFEFIMSVDVYNELFSNKYRRPRDAAAAALNKRDMEICKFCDLIPLRLYNGQSDIMLIPLNIGMGRYKITDYEAIEEVVQRLTKDNFIASIPDIYSLSSGVYTNYNRNYECDGVVVSIVETFGVSEYDEDFVYEFEESTPAFYKSTGTELAIKIINLKKETKLIDVKYEYGLTGRITPVAILEPVKFDNITVDHVSLSNPGRVLSMGLKKNDTVEIMYNIVPYFIRSHHDGDELITVPSRCPLCGNLLDTGSDYATVTCINRNCIGLNIGSITRYLKIIGAMGIDEATVTKFINAGIIKKIPDLYKLTVEDIKKVEGFKDKSAANIINSIKRASTNLSFVRFLGAFQFRLVSTRTWEAICRALEMDSKRFADISREDFIELLCTSLIPGVGSVIRRAIIEGLEYLWDDIKECMNYITFEEIKQLGAKGVITMTGTHDKDFIMKAIDAGYDVRGWSMKTTHVVVKDLNYSSSTVALALEKGVPIYTIEQFEEKFL